MKKLPLGLRKRRLSAHLADVYEDFVPSNLDWIGIDAQRGAGDNPAGGDIVLPAVPGAGDHIAVKLALPKRSCLVNAYATESTDLTGYVGHRDGLSSYLKFADRSGRDFTFSRRSHKCHHWLLRPWAELISVSG